MSGSCCFKGHIHTGEPKGTTIKLAGTETYFAEAEKFDGRALLFLSDAFGLELVNNKLLVDSFAKQANLNVYMPDQFNGNPAPISALQGVPFDFMAWGKSFSKEACYDNNVKFANELKEKHGVTKLAVIGYCWGGFSTLMIGATDIANAVAVAHPSRLDFPGDIERIKKPCLFLCAEVDHQFPLENVEKSKEILKDRPEGHKFVQYPGTNHGFAVRFNGDDEVAAKAAEDAFQQAIQFFNKHL
ncbi:AIM2 [Acrasis kona]|uniref:AIM2 n=1 Tax=Acrasis kona TaxID=1008807 RepID=A0AAW2YI98_9EUKA